MRNNKTGICNRQTLLNYFTIWLFDKLLVFFQYIAS